MTEWKEWSGSLEQIAEVAASKKPVLMRYSTGREVKWGASIFKRDLSMLGFKDVTHYLICNPHPLADMICRQARTGQPVWVKTTEWLAWKCIYDGDYFIFVTTAPDWDIPNAKYSFTPFGEEV